MDTGGRELLYTQALGHQFAVGRYMLGIPGNYVGKTLTIVESRLYQPGSWDTIDVAEYTSLIVENPFWLRVGLSFGYNSSSYDGFTLDIKFRVS